MRSADPLSSSKPKVLAPPGRCTVSASRQGRAGGTRGSLPTGAGSWGRSEEELRQSLIRECSRAGAVPGRGNREQDHPRCDRTMRRQWGWLRGFVGTEGQESGVHAEVVPGAESLGCR